MGFVFSIAGLLAVLVLVGIGAMVRTGRYHEGAGDVDTRTFAEYGAPSRTLFTSQKVFSLHSRMTVTDASGQTVYETETKFPSLHDRTDIFRADGSLAAHFDAKFLTLHERHFVTMADGLSFEMSNELFHLVRDVTNIEGLGWRLEGNILALNFTIRDADGEILAVIGNKVLSIHNKASIDIYRPEYTDILVTIDIVLQHMLRNRQAASSASASSASN